VRYWVQLATEQFPPSELVEQALAAERASFDGLNVSDHYQPWWEPGHSGQAWALLGAIGQATERIAVGTGVTAPVYRYNPAVVAQFGATLQELFGGRGFLGIGSGESLNESPAGMDWPDTGEQVPYGQLGQVVMNHISKGMFLPNNLERDMAVRMPGPAGQLSDSVSAVRPVATFDGEAVIEGVY